MYDSRNDNMDDEMGDDEVRGSEVSQCQTPVEWERYLPVNVNTRTVWSVSFPIYMGTDAQHQREGRPRWTPYRQSAEMREGIYYTCVIPGVSWLFLAELERRVVSKVLYGSGCGRGREVLAVSSKGFFAECPSGRRGSP